ncbi:TonB-dependent Receptor Plug Domain protein [compost metagenome]
MRHSWQKEWIYIITLKHNFYKSNLTKCMNFNRVFKGNVLKAVHSKKLLSTSAKRQIIMSIKMIVFLLTFFMTQVSANSFGQKITYQKANASLKDVFKEIQKQTGYNVFFGVEKLKMANTKSVNFKQESLDRVLKYILEEKGLDYSIKNNTIVISNKPASAEYRSGSYFADIIIKGKVTDKDGKPLLGATISIKGTKKNAVSDAEGNYTIVASENDLFLVFSFTGFTTKEVRINDQNIININLEENIGSLSELVVVGYGVKAKGNLVSSVSQINTELLKKVPVANVSNALEGLAPGLFVRQTSGEPGFSDSRFEIRNFGNALVIIDGSPGDINKLDPNEVESISILKDAAAASIYGVQGGNGVVLVKTRRGELGKPKLSYSNQFTFSTPTSFPDYLNSEEYAIMSNQMSVNSGQAPKYSEQDIEKYRNGSDPLKYPNTNWFKETLNRYSTQQRHNLNVSGGTQDTKYFLSAGFIDQGSLYKANNLNFNQYNIRGNIDTKILDNLELSFNLAARRQNRDAPGYSAYDIYRSLHRNLPIDLAYYPDGTAAKPTNSPVHPVEGLKNSNVGYYKDANNNIDAKLSLKWDIKQVPGLSLSSFASVVYDNTYNKNWVKAYTVYTLNPVSGNYDPFVVSPEGAASRTILTENATYNNNYVLQQTLNYKNSFGGHNVGGLLVWETQKQGGNNFFGRRQDFQSDLIDQMFAGSNKNKDASGSQWRENRLGLIGRGTYDYKAKYLAEFSFRYDGSSKFAPGKNWGFFPSGSLGWRISDEAFFAPLKTAVQDLKFRASVGTAGNDGNAAYQWLSGFNYNGFFVIKDQAVPTIDNSSLANIDVTWSNIVTYNAGVDFTILNKTTTVTFDYFKRDQSDVLASGSAKIPSTLGVGLSQQNLYKYSNQGFEVNVNHSNKINEDLSYSIGASFSRSRERAIFIDEQFDLDPFVRNQLSQTGRLNNRRVGHVSDGLFQTAEEITAHAIQDGNNNSTIRPGDVRFKDLNGDGIINDKDRAVIGRGEKPDMNYSMNLGLNYKNFSLSVLLTGAAGYTMYIDGEAQAALKNGFNGYKYQMNFWTPENTGAPYPRPVLGGSNPNNYRYSDFWLRSGTHLRVRNINLSYNLPKKFRDKLRIGEARFFVTGNNLWVISGIKEGFDPQWTGGNGYYYPQTKSYTFGLNLSI